MSTDHRTPSAVTEPSLRLTPLLFAALTGTMAMMAYVAVIGPAARQLGLPEWTVGLSITAGGLFWMALARWWGGISDRHGRKPVLLTGFGVCAVTSLILAAGVDLGLRGHLGATAVIVLLVTARSLIGAVYAAVPPCSAALIADHTPPPERPAGMAKLGTANALGMVAGPATAGMLATYDLGLALYAAAALPALAMLVIGFALPQDSRTRGPRPGPQAAVKLFDPRLRLPCVTALIAMSSAAIAQVLVGFIAIDRLGLNPQDGARTAGLALTAVGIALIGAQQFVMRLENVPLTRWVSVGALFAGTGFASVAFVHTQTGLLGCYAAAAFGMGFIFPSFQTMAANAVGKHEQGVAAGTVSTAQGFGMVVAPLAGTLLYRIAPGLPYLLVGGLMIGLALFTALSRPLPPRSEPAPSREHS